MRARTTRYTPTYPPAPHSAVRMGDLLARAHSASRGQSRTNTPRRLAVIRLSPAVKMSPVGTMTNRALMMSGTRHKPHSRAENVERLLGSIAQSTNGTVRPAERRLPGTGAVLYMPNSTPEVAYVSAAMPASSHMGCREGALACPSSSAGAGAMSGRGLMRSTPHAANPLTMGMSKMSSVAISPGSRSTGSSTTKLRR